MLRPGSCWPDAASLHALVQVLFEALRGPDSRAHPSAALVALSLPRSASQEQVLPSDC